MSKIDYTPELLDLRERTLLEFYNAVKRQETIPHAIGLKMKDGWSTVATGLTYQEQGVSDSALAVLEASMKTHYGKSYDLEAMIDLRENIVDITCSERGSIENPVISINGVLETDPPAP